jgi:hypothetical protein
VNAANKPTVIKSVIEMSYQNPTRAVQESYGAEEPTTTLSSLLSKTSSGPTNPNVGVSNSSRGQGTTLSEIVSKMRFLNCVSCLTIIIFHSTPLLLNPIRLTVLIGSPLRLVFEVTLAILALSLFVVEARIPIVGQRVLDWIRGSSDENVARDKLDLDTARGRMTVLVIMACVCGLINYLSADVGGVSDANLVHNQDAAMDSQSANATLASNRIDTEAAAPINTNTSSSDTFAMLSVIIQCTVFSPSLCLLVSLIAYTSYIMQSYLDYVHWRAYPEPSSHSVISGGANSARSSGGGTGGYQTSAPSWAQPTV